MFEPQPKSRIEIVRELFNHRERAAYFTGAICDIHSSSTLDQDASIKLLLRVLQAGHTVDLLLQDGTDIRNSNVNDARVKLVYNTSVTPPSNGVVKWQPYSTVEGIN